MENHVLYTEWGKNLDPQNILPEYPRPQLVRKNWRNLNGYWDYAITKFANEPENYDGKILVPFSPEAPLSGVMRQLLPDEYLHYRLIFEHDGTPAAHVILHFGAVDERCKVYLNGKKIGEHRGGYLPFEFDIASVLKEGKNVLTLCVQDFSDSSYHANGKQVLKRGGIWYTAQSGIWQTVWLEEVPENYIEHIKITPVLKSGTVLLEIAAKNPESAQITVFEHEEAVAEDVTDEHGKAVLKFNAQCPVRPWSPDDPFLYDVKITLGEDEITSYFAMREFTVLPDEHGVMRLVLNGKPLFHSGVLDQGYWPDGLYTAPSDDAMIHDITAMKRLGFNMLRKHIKVEPLRWYYHCDRLGMLVWQDMVSGGVMRHFMLKSALSTIGITKLRDDKYGFFGRRDAAGREEFILDMEGTVRHLYNCSCIAMWCIFNEGWGQFDSRKAYEKLLALDCTRSVDIASGWHDQGDGKICSLHVYFRRFRMVRDRRAVVLSEFGGYNCHVAGHCFNDANYGYRRFADCEKLTAAFCRLYQNEILPAKAQGLCAAVYTQLSDVEDEQNGILTYDRAVCKLPEDEIAAINEILTKGKSSAAEV